jgi:hypothetical protein
MSTLSLDIARIRWKTAGQSFAASYNFICAASQTHLIVTLSFVPRQTQIFYTPFEIHYAFSNVVKFGGESLSML